MRLEEQRSKKKRERVNVLWKSVLAFRRSNMTPREFFPTIGSIISVPRISKILDKGSNEDFEELNDDIADQLPGIADKIRRDREEALLKLLPPGYTSPEPLKLATTWFKNGFVLRVARAEDVINELWKVARRDAWDNASLNGGTCWSSIAPEIAFEEKVMAAVTKIITDAGVGDPEKMTAEELDHASCRVVMFVKHQYEPVLRMEVGSWRHLVRDLSPPTPLEKHCESHF